MSWFYFACECKLEQGSTLTYVSTFLSPMFTIQLTRAARRAYSPASACIRLLSTGKTYENIIVSRPESGVALFTLNRPKALNALNSVLISELNEAMAEADADSDVAALVLTGSERAFAGPYAVKFDRASWMSSHAASSNFRDSWS